MRTVALPIHCDSARCCDGDRDCQCLSLCVGVLRCRVFDCRLAVDADGTPLRSGECLGAEEETKPCAA